MMTYQQAVDFLYSQLPMFQRSGPAAYKKGMGNIAELCAMLGNPHRNIKTVHVAGTNGKGSTSHMLAAIFQTAGYKTGLFTSPHLKDFRERIRVNGKMIPRKEVIQFVQWMEKAAMHLQPSFFEMNVVLAFYYFAKQKVDIAIIETGLGGRLDSTNIIEPELSIITNIGYDHMELLGNTLGKIAKEKAGIIKPHTPVVISEFQLKTFNVFLKKSYEVDSPIYFAKDLVSVFDTSETMINGRANLKLYVETKDHTYIIHSPLAGAYQQANIAGVIASVELLMKQGWKINKLDVEYGVSRVDQLTGIKGRWQQISYKPLVICDTGHNKDGIQQVLHQLSQMKFEKLHIVFGMVADKDRSSILRMLPQDAQYYFCSPAIPRGLDSLTLKNEAHDFQLKGRSYASVKHALKAAKRKAGEQDLIFVGGSTFVVAEVV
ncbi:MAG: bifunctional folylpolyglutamate synthase/dihydrofolate synthase [Flavobacteriales bacterium]